MALATLAPFRPRCASILFLHRFAVADLGVAGHDPDILRQHLEYLRAHKYRLLSISDLLDHIEHDIPLDRTSVVFTVDDGYADFATVAAPLFAAYDCPVTVFLVTDFVSGRLWNWFDKVAWAFRESDRDVLDVEIDNMPILLRWKDAVERERASYEIIERLKRVSDRARDEGIFALASALEVSLPNGVPVRDRAMTWDQVRACASRGVTFGPHTVTHPILSRVDAQKAESEISQSWRVVLAETEASVPVFCYPNGTLSDFSSREKQMVQRAGMRAALSTIPGSVRSTDAGIKFGGRFSLPRFSYAEDRPSFVQIVSGLHAMRDEVRINRRDATLS